MTRDKAVEVLWPFLVGLVFGAASRWVPAADRQQVILDAAPQFLVLLAILVGFLATALAVLLTAQDVPAIQRMKDTLAFPALVGYHNIAIRLGLIASVCSIGAMIVARAWGKEAIGGMQGSVILAVWWGICGLALALAYRAFTLTMKLLRIHPEP